MDRHGKVTIDEDAMRDHRFHMGGAEVSDDKDIEGFLLEFRDLYRLPPAQRIISRLYPLRTLVHLWNAWLMKVSREGPDQLGTLMRVERYRSSQGIGPAETRFLVRVDDYPRFDVGIEGFMGFHDVAREHGVDYLLGVTPFLSDSPFEPSDEATEPLSGEEVDLLGTLSRDGVEFGVHGATHRTLHRRYRTETVGLSPAKLRGGLTKAKGALSDLGIAAEVYVPPFNTVDARNIHALKGLFRVVTGGPETIPLLGSRLSPSSIDGIVHLPVYRPFYGKCEDLVPVISADLPRVPLIPLAIHWSWESGSGFKHFERLCEAIEGRTVRWDATLFPV